MSKRKIKRRTKKTLTQKSARRKIKRRVIVKRKIKRRPDSKKAPKKFTRIKRKMILEGLRAGVDIKRVCDLAGVSVNTYHTWLRRGKESGRPGKYTYFRKKVKRIEYEKEKEALTAIRKAYNGESEVWETKIKHDPMKGTSIEKITKQIPPQWQAAAWRLERKYWDDYGPGDKLGDLGKSTAEEMAREIKAAADILFATVPGKPTMEDIPADMPV